MAEALQFYDTPEELDSPAPTTGGEIPTNLNFGLIVPSDIVSPTNDILPGPQTLDITQLQTGAPNRKRTNLSPQKETEFQNWYKNLAQRNGLSLDPDAPEHKYDYRGAFAAGATPDVTGHWPSQFKDEDHPRRFLRIGDKVVDTTTGKPAPTRPQRPQLRTPVATPSGTLGAGGSILDYAFAGTKKVQPGYSTPSGIAVGHTPIRQRPQRPQLRTTAKAQTLAEDKGMYGGFERGLSAGSASAMSTVGGLAQLLADMSGAQTSPTGKVGQQLFSTVGNWLVGKSAQEAKDVADALELMKQQGGESYAATGARKATEIGLGLTPVLAASLTGLGPAGLFAIQEMANARARGVTDPVKLGLQAAKGAYYGKVFGAASTIGGVVPRLGAQAGIGAGQALVDPELNRMIEQPETIPEALGQAVGGLQQITQTSQQYAPMTTRALSVLADPALAIGLVPVEKFKEAGINIQPPGHSEPVNWGAVAEGATVNVIMDVVFGGLGKGRVAIQSGVKVTPETITQAARDLPTEQLVTALQTDGVAVPKNIDRRQLLDIVDEYVSTKSIEGNAYGQPLPSVELGVVQPAPQAPTPRPQLPQPPKGVGRATANVPFVEEYVNQLTPTELRASLMDMGVNVIPDTPTNELRQQLIDAQQDLMSRGLQDPGYTDPDYARREQRRLEDVYRGQQTGLTPAPQVGARPPEGELGVRPGAGYAPPTIKLPREARVEGAAVEVPSQFGEALESSRILGKRGPKYRPNLLEPEITGEGGEVYPIEGRPPSTFGANKPRGLQGEGLRDVYDPQAETLNRERGFERTGTQLSANPLLDPAQWRKLWKRDRRGSSELETEHGTGVVLPYGKGKYEAYANDEPLGEFPTEDAAYDAVEQHLSGGDSDALAKLTDDELERTINRLAGDTTITYSYKLKELRENLREAETDEAHTEIQDAIAALEREQASKNAEFQSYFKERANRRARATLTAQQNKLASYYDRLDMLDNQLIDFEGLSEDKFYQYSTERNRLAKDILDLQRQGIRHPDYAQMDAEELLPSESTQEREGFKLSANPFLNPQSYRRFGEDLTNFFRTRFQKGQDPLKALKRAKDVGVKQASIDYTGIEQFLKDNPNATIDEITAHIEQNSPRFSAKSVSSVSKDFGATSYNPTHTLRLPGESSNYREDVITWDNPPEGVSFKNPVHYGNQENVAFDVRLEDRPTIEGDDATFFMETQSDWAQMKNVPDMPIKSTWVNKAVDYVLSDVVKNGKDGVLLPSTPEQIAELQKWNNFRQEGGRYLEDDVVTGKTNDVTAVVNRYIKEIPKLFEKQSGQTLQQRTVDLGDGRREEFGFIAVPEEFRGGGQAEPELTGQPVDDFLTRLRNMKPVEPGQTQTYTDQPTTRAPKGWERAGDDIPFGEEPEMPAIGPERRAKITRYQTDSGVDVTLEEYPNAIRVGGIDVPPTQRGQGQGSAAMQEILDRATEEGKPVFLTASAQSSKLQPALNRFYERLGFKKYAEDPLTKLPRYRFDPPTTKGGGTKTYSNPLFDPELYQKFLGKGRYAKRGQYTEEPGPPPNVYSSDDKALTPGQLEALDIIHKSVDDAVKGFSDVRSQYIAAKTARTAARNKLQELLTLQKQQGYLDPAKKTELSQAIKDAQAERDRTLEESQKAYKVYKPVALTEARAKTIPQAEAARARLEDQYSYRIDPDIPYLDEVVNPQISKQFLRAAKDVFVSQGRLPDPDKLVIDQVRELAYENKIPLAFMDEIFERNGVSLADFLDGTAGLRKAVRSGASIMARLSHIQRNLNKLRRSDPALAAKYLALEPRLPTITELNRLYKERSNWDRATTIMQGLWVSAVQTALKNLGTAGIEIGLDSMGQLMDSAYQGVHYGVAGRNPGGNKNMLSPVMAVRPLINLFGQAFESLGGRKLYGGNKSTVRETVELMQEAFPKEFDQPLFDILNADLESPKYTDASLKQYRKEVEGMPDTNPRKAKLTKALDEADARFMKTQGKVTQAFIRGEELVHKLGWANYGQERIARRAVSEAKLMRYTTEAGIDLREALTGESSTLAQRTQLRKQLAGLDPTDPQFEKTKLKLADIEEKYSEAPVIPDDILKRVVHDTLRTTMGLRPERGSKGDFINKALTGPLGFAIKVGMMPFPNFYFHNFLRWQYEHSPAGVLSLLNGNERARVAKGDLGVFWKAITGTALFGMFLQMANDHYDKKGSQEIPGEEGLAQRTIRKTATLGGNITPATRGERWYEMNWGGRNIDARFLTMAPQMFLADMLVRSRRGLSGYTPKDFLAGMGFGTKNLEAVGGVVGDAIDSLKDVASSDDMTRGGGKYFGAIASGILTPLKTYVEGPAQFFSENERKARDTNAEAEGWRGFTEAFRKQIQDKTPWWRQALPERESSLREPTPMAQAPLVRELFPGVTLTEPKNFLESETASLGITPQQIVPHTGNAKADRMIDRYMGQFTEGTGLELAKDTSYTSLPAEQRRQVLIDIIFPQLRKAAIKGGIAEVPEELVKSVLQKALTKEQLAVEERRRRKAGEPGLQKSAVEEVKKTIPSPTPTPSKIQFYGTLEELNKATTPPR